MAGQTQNTNNGVGGLYKRSLPTIADVVRHKIGEIIDLSAYQLRNTHSQPDNIGWFYNDNVRNKYTDYRTYIDEVYTSKNDVPVTEFTAFSTPFKTIDSMLGASDHITDMVHNNSPFQTVRELVGNRDNDTVMAMYGHEAGRHALYKTYSATKLHHNVYPGRGISRGINNTLGLVGHLNGFDIYVNPETGRSGDLDYSQRVYANYDNTVGASVNYEDLAGYFTVDSGYDTHLYAEGSELTQSTVEALRKNLYTGENVLAGESGGIGNKYRSDDDGVYSKLYHDGDYGLHGHEETSTGYLLDSGDGGTIKKVYRESQEVWLLDWPNIRVITFANGDDNPSTETLLGETATTSGVGKMHSIGSDILKITNAAFRNGLYKTLISRFCGQSEKNRSEIGTAVDSTFGISHGRNLLTKDAEGEGKAEKYTGYMNPYCRVWTNHHEYSQYKKAIRPFDDDQVPKQGTAGEKKDWDDYRNYGGSRRLDDYSVLKLETNTLRITPTYSDTGGYNKDVKRCMFSIENLAWKGFTKQLLPDQQGPFGGRIMWFPPYGLTFNEATNVNWSENEFIGRGEKIFTYVNSERRGNIDFKLLIDHPAIINSFRSKDDGGKVSDTDLLRFYAGCDVPEQDKPKKPEPTYSLEIIPKDIPEKEVKKIVFAVFYPNNYSGTEKIDDKGRRVDDNSTDVNYPIMYLLNGIGTGEYYNATSGKQEIIPYKTGESKDWFKSYELISEGDSDTINPGKKTRVKVKNKNNVKSGEFNGGFEMGRSGNFGVSVCSKNLPVEKPYNYWKPNVEIVGDSITNLGFSYNICKKDDKTYVLSAISTTRDKTNDELWFYRIDKYYRVSKKMLKCKINGKTEKYYLGGEILSPASQCSDLKSWGLNSKIGLNRVQSVISRWANNGSGAKVVSFADMARAIMPEQTASMCREYYDQDNVNFINEIIRGTSGGKKKYNVKDIDVRGVASWQGHSPKNINWLAPGRAKTVANWLNFWLRDLNMVQANANNKTIGASNVFDLTSNEAKRQTSNDNNDIKIKLEKCAVVTISFDQVESESESVEDKRTNYLGEYTLEDLCRIIPIKNENELYQWAGENGYTVRRHDTTSDSNNQLLKGYGDEYKFFKELKREDPTAFNKLMTKIKYFEPAYHSISPEGFVERLNFINQCTRQGATNTGSGNAANNLAFGRPPVCVLRIGDFFYTKILITGINIEYSEATWDMNPEGAGVQPMYADVNISFIFQGGSDITGPVSRLQDAMSFNYYANMGVTSPYAERMIRDKNTKEVTGIIASPLKRDRTDKDK